MSEYAFGILNWLGNRTYQGSVHIFLGWTINPFVSERPPSRDNVQNVKKKKLEGPN